MASGEGAGARLERRVYHFLAHPLAWLHWIWVRELRTQEIYFRDHPRFLFWRPMYRVARRPMARVVGRPLSELDAYFDELAPLHAELRREVSDLPIAGALSQAPLLYVIVRAMKPRWLVETGISSGYSTRLLLEALERNGEGHLDSIGIDVFALRRGDAAPAAPLAGRRVGWLVPERFADRWRLHLGRSDEVLPGLLDGKGPTLDLFLHDSLHQYATMRWEYETAWPSLRPSGLLASHDIHASSAWPEFLQRHRVSADADLDRDLGIARAGPA
ncbi:MAG TPA: class I SAM-dependent methyltransferase [Thermoplasmata archaeon]|nr:class I SAM-dependent methyltransferase [Thermoplasmata archaeon]